MGKKREETTHDDVTKYDPDWYSLDERGRPHVADQQTGTRWKRKLPGAE